MPGGDRTGPRGEGPRTGRAAGFCAGYDVLGYMDPVPGYGRGWGRGGRFGWGRGYGGGRGMAWRHGQGRGRGGGRGWGRGQGWGPGWYGGPAWPEPYWGPTAPGREEELALLKDEAAAMEAGLEDIRARMAELEKAQAEKKE